MHCLLVLLSENKTCTKNMGEHDSILESQEELGGPGEMGTRALLLVNESESTLSGTSSVELCLHSMWQELALSRFNHTQK